MVGLAGLLAFAASDTATQMSHAASLAAVVLVSHAALTLQYHIDMACLSVQVCIAMCTVRCITLYCSCLSMQVCVFISSVGWCWGPLGWLVPSEIQPLTTWFVCVGVRLHLICGVGLAPFGVAGPQ